MSAVILAFPRRKPLEEHEYPAYWGYMEKTYYEMRIEDGVSHEDAFAEWNRHARERHADHEADARRASERKQSRKPKAKREG